MRKQDWLVGLLHSAIWIGAILLGSWGLRGNSAAVAYAAICAWWATLYAALLFRTPWRAVLAFLVVMIAALSVDTVAGWNLLYHDAPDLFSGQFLAAAALLCVMWASPFIVNAIARWAYKRIAAAAQ